MKQLHSQRLGVLIAIVSSCVGGTAAAVTRYLAGSADPLTLAILRWGIGFLCVLPVALVLRVRWPRRNDWAHQPGSEPIDIPETIPNPIVVPKPTPTPTEPAPKEPVRIPERVPGTERVACSAGRSGQSDRGGRGMERRHRAHATR